MKEVESKLENKIKELSIKVLKLKCKEIQKELSIYKEGKTDHLTFHSETNPSSRVFKFYKTNTPLFTVYSYSNGDFYTYNSLLLEEENIKFVLRIKDEDNSYDDFYVEIDDENHLLDNKLSTEFKELLKNISNELKSPQFIKDKKLNTVNKLKKILSK